MEEIPIKIYKFIKAVPTSSIFKDSNPMTILTGLICLPRINTSAAELFGIDGITENFGYNSNTCPWGCQLVHANSEISKQAHLFERPCP